MNEQPLQEKQQRKLSGSGGIMLAGGAVLLVDLIFYLGLNFYVSTSAHSTTYGVEEGAIMISSFLVLLVVIPAAVAGIILLIVGLIINLRKKANL